MCYSPMVADIQRISLQAQRGIGIGRLRSQYSGDHDSSGQCWLGGNDGIDEGQSSESQAHNKMCCCIHWSDLLCTEVLY
ncbi:hypothetical protein D3C80_1817360 [compost metagenome]